jgi:hypothetical protein
MEVPMPELVRLYIRSVALGFAISAAFTAGLVWWDVAGIGHLILGSDIGLVAAVMLVVFNGIIFSAVQFAFKIMAMAEDDSGPKGGHKAHTLIPIPVTAPAKTPARHGQGPRR